jgi:DNA repair exonuclease SbcCD ATPase subunit
MSDIDQMRMSLGMPKPRHQEEPTMTPTDAKDETPRCDALIKRLIDGSVPVPSALATLAETLERALLAAQTENERLARERDELRRIRELCIKALMRATGDSRDAIEDAPVSRAIKAAERLQAAQTENERFARELSAERSSREADSIYYDSLREKLDETERALMSANQQRSEEGERRCATIARLTAELSAERAAGEAAQRALKEISDSLHNAELDEHEGDWTERAQNCIKIADAARGSHEA